MLRFPHTYPDRPLSPTERLQREEEDLRLLRPSWQPLSLPQACQAKLTSKEFHVAVVGGGLAGLMAARRLVEHGIKVTVFEARKEVGGRVESDHTFSKGRVTEFGAELIGSFHTRCLDLALKYGLAMISRMDDDLYERERLDIKLRLDGELIPMAKIIELKKDMMKILRLIAVEAKKVVHPSEPWLELRPKERLELITHDNTSVADALKNRYGVPEGGFLWKMLEFLLVNDEVAPLEKMNFLGLLCKVKGAQSVQFSDDDAEVLNYVNRGNHPRQWKPLSEDAAEAHLMRYWTELEIFRCADGCQELATEMAKEITTSKDKGGPDNPAVVRRQTAVTHINLSELGVTLLLKDVRNNKPLRLEPIIFYNYVILAIPPSVWDRVTITRGGKIAKDRKKDVNLDQEVGVIGMGPAVKFFSDVKKRFWIKEKAAPSGGSLRLGQVWEGTDNQTRLDDPNVATQGIVLSVFAGPIIRIDANGKKDDRGAYRRAPDIEDCKNGLRSLYPGYTDNLIKNKKNPIIKDWPKEPFIKTGYAAPTIGQIFKIGDKLTKPIDDLLFFAGEHTHMDFFGYMEGALRSGERAADTLINQACGLTKKAAPAPPSPQGRIASAAPIRAKTAAEYESESRWEEYSSTDYAGEAESPFFDRNLFAAGAGEEWEPRAAMLVAESPFVGALEERQSRFDEDQSEEEESPDEPEGEEQESLDDEDAPLHEDETEVESPAHAFEAVEEGSSSTLGPEGDAEEPELAREAFDTSPELEEQVLTLPAGLPGLPNDATLRGQLQAMGTAAARALDAAFAVVGDPVKFSNRLPAALNATFESLRGGPSQRFRIHVARLGAEAFILDTPTEPDNRYDNFVDHPDRLGSALTGADGQNFVHFAMRRLHQISPIVVKPPTHRRQMNRAAAMFRLFQSDLTSHAPFFVDNTLLLAYRTLAVQILWRHYQALQDGVLEAAARSRLRWEVVNKEWEKDLELAAITHLVDDGNALAPTFRLTPTLYRDYFNPAAASDIGFQHYTSTPIPVTGHGPEMPYRIVFRRRAEQKAFIERLRNEREADLLPKLHDTNSWQAWVRETWDSPLLRRETTLEVILNYVSGYFEAFTVHAPHDLREGCSVPNYLTRAFPRAITGSLVHDCFVYAVRWLHILGRLLSPGSTPLGIANPRIFLVEMPAHVGVMIDADTTALNRHVVVSINNKHAAIHTVSDTPAVENVVQDMYRGPRTPFVLRSLTSNPADAKALWNEVCKLSEKKLTLPYKDSKSPPHLRYLKHNALLANIAREHSDAVRASWATLHQRLETAKDGRGNVLRARVIDEIQRHAASFEKANQAAKARLDNEREPLIKEINDDLAANQQRVPQGVSIIETNPDVPLLDDVKAYRKELQKAMRSGDLSGIHPEMFFPEDDFVAAVE